MRAIKTTSILFLLFISSLAVHSTSKLFPGYYIDKNGDSVLCKIEFSDWNKNPKNIQVEINNERKTLGVADIRGFGVFGYGDYKAATVTCHTNPISTTSGSLPEEFSDNKEIKDCFLRIVVKGAYTLYELVLPERPYYFISDTDTAISELVYRVRQKDLQINEDLQYKNVLAGFFAREGILDRYQFSINNTGYNSSNIASLIKILNEKHTGIHLKKTKTRVIQADIIVGGIMSRFPSSFNGRYSKMNKFSPSFAPAGGLSLLFVFPNRFNSFAAGISAEYYQYSSSVTKAGAISDTMSAYYYYTTTYSEKLSTMNSLIMTNFYAIYFINHLSKTRIYLKAGASINISVKKDIDIHSKYTFSTTGIQNGNVPISGSGQGDMIVATIAKTFVSFNPAVGLLNGRNKLEFTYSYSPTELSLTDGTSFRTGMTGIHYYYTFFK